jgi:hypothetical protein
MDGTLKVFLQIPIHSQIEWLIWGKALKIVSETRGDQEGESYFIHGEGVIRGRGIGDLPEAADPWQEPTNLPCLNTEK